MNRLSKVLGIVFFVIFLMSGYAGADTYSFYNITNNDPADAAIGEAQLFVDVEAYGDNQALFTFRNEGPADSSITDIYFDDDVPLLVYQNFIYNTTGVEFTVGAKPEDLPGGTNYTFTSNYSYDSDNPTQPNGINPGEELGILFNLNNTTFDQVLAAIDDGSFRIGIHVQGFESGGSEGFIAPNETTPEPATMFLLGTGLVGLAGFRKRFSKN